METRNDERVNILLVDDQPNNLLALKAMLEDLDLNLVTAESGTKALKCLLDQEFATILLDVQMPGMDGFETAAMIREREKSRTTPIIFLTAASRSDVNVFKGYSLGAVDYLFKPIVPEILQSKVNVFVNLFRMNAALRRQTQELERLNRQTELILKSAADGVVGVDLEGKVTFVNPAAARMLDVKPEEVIGGNLHQLFHAGENSTYCLNENCSFTEAFDPQELTSNVEDDVFIRRDGTAFPVEYCGNPIRDEEGGGVGIVITFRDVTERRAAAQAEENERLYREAQAASQAKDHFLATLSHELRTPMTAILGWVQILRMGDADLESLEAGLETIEGSARAQARLIDDMLDVSRIILGKFTLEHKPTDIASVVEKAVETVRLSAAEKTVRLTTNIQPEVGKVAGDANRLQQVVWNLLSNAIKFTESGGQVDVSLERVGGTVRVIVADSGEGIAPEFLPHVFERLQQAKDLNNKGGLGLGLAIAHHIIEQHGGEISAESDGEGKGARFTVTLPLLDQPAELSSPASETVSATT